MSSINHYSSPPESLWWPSQYTVQQQQQQHQSSSPTKTSSSSTIASGAMLGRHGRTPHTFNLNNYDDNDEEQESLVTEKQFVNNVNIGNLDNEEYMKQPLFEKALTPSDVGKLNRLVIPKQHAEKYFPINGGDNSDKGLLLSFEDEVGKFWKFRYSYWNSSQSYVLTKGWSRFVKEKRLDAGDVVLFFRHRVDSTRLFIGWRRRSTGGGEEGGVAVSQGSGGGVGGVWNRGFYSTLGPQQQQQQQHPYPNLSRRSSTLLPYQTDHCLHAAGSILQNQTTTTSVSGNSKTVRLFGVNLECQADVSEPSTPDGSPMSGQGQAHMINPYHQFYTNHQNHMDMIINFSGGGGDVYRQG